MFVFKILFSLLTWLTTFANATTSCQNIALHHQEISNTTTAFHPEETKAKTQEQYVAKETSGAVREILEFGADQVIKVLREIDPGLAPPQVVYDLGEVSIKQADLTIQRQLQIVKTGDGQVFVKVVQGAGNWASAFPKLASKTYAWSHLELVFEGVDDYVRILSKNGDEVAKVFKNGTDEVFEIADDFFKATPTNPATPITGITVKANTGETIIGGGFFKNADGSIGFVEDVSSYGSTIVQNTIKNRGSLRGTLSGIQATEDAHHIIPVQLLKENDVVKKGVEGGFDFNGATNGLAIEKYSKSTGLGRHGPHPNYTTQIRQALDDWAEITPNYTPQQAKEFLEIITADIKNTINTTTVKINELNLGF